MKLSEAYKNYTWPTETASELTRQLSFAGIAIVWIFAVRTEGGISLPSGLIWACLLLSLCLAFNVLQYASAAVMWGRFYRQAERQYLTDENNDPDVPNADSRINWPAHTFNLLKWISLLVGWISLTRFLVQQLFTV